MFDSLLVKKIGEKTSNELKQNIPSLDYFKNTYYDIRFRFKYDRYSTQYKKDVRYDKYEEEIKKYYNLHKGERCFILGSGPSLKKTNLDLIKDEIIFGVNTIYKILKQYDLKFKYYNVGDVNVWKEYYKKILSQDTTLFMGGILANNDYLDNYEYYSKFQKNEPILIRYRGPLRLQREWKDNDLVKGNYGAHQIIANQSLQLAHYMGFDEVYILGCDCSYAGKSHHFDGENYSFQAASTIRSSKYWDETFKEYDMIRKGYEKTGRKVYNATVGGKLDVFERKSLEEVFDEWKI